MFDSNKKAAAEQADRVHRALSAAYGPFIDALDENGPATEQSAALVGLLVGCRHWISQFAALEAVIVPQLVSAGSISEEAYRSMCEISQKHAGSDMQTMLKAFQEEEAKRGEQRD